MVKFSKSNDYETFDNKEQLDCKNGQIKQPAKFYSVLDRYVYTALLMLGFLINVILMI